MARNLITIDEVVNDFLLSIEGDDFARNASDILVRNYALRGLRELGFDLSKRVRSLSLPVESNDTVTLPDDFVNLIKIGTVGTDGLVRVFARNQHIDIKQAYSYLADGVTPIDSNADGVNDRVDAKTVGTESILSGDEDFFVFSNYLHQGSMGQLYGIGGGFSSGEYRMNHDQNRIELKLDSDITEVVVEYIADEARSECPTVSILLEEALRAYIYWKLVSRKANVPANEKARARNEWYNEKRLGRARMNPLSKEELLHVGRKNYRQSPKY